MTILLYLLITLRYLHRNINRPLMQANLLNDHTLIHCTGKDAKTFLQGQLTCDLEYIDQGHCTLGAHCNIKGRMISLGYVLPFEAGYLLCFPSDIVETALTALKKYVLFSKVIFTDISAQYQLIGLITEDERILQGGEDIHIFSVHAQRHLLIAPKSFSPKMILERLTSINETIAQSTLDFTTISPDSHQWHSHLISTLTPWLSKNTVDLFIPNELGLTETPAVSLKKGCYVGQEIIARLYYRGKLKKHLVQKTAKNTLLIAGELIQDADQKPKGQVVSVSESNLLILEKI